MKISIFFRHSLFSFGRSVFSFGRSSLSFPRFFIWFLHFFIPVLLLFPPGSVCCSQEIASSFSKLYAGFSVCSDHFRDAFSFTVNQAALADPGVASGGLFSEKPWLLDNLFQYSAALAMPLKKAGIGMVADYAGDGQYRQWQVGCAYGRKLTEHLDIGVQFNYREVGISGYGNSGGMTAELGVLIHLTPQLQAGMHIIRAGPATRDGNGSRHPASVYSSGLGYEVSPKVFLKLDLSKEEGQPVRLMTGIQYDIKKQVFIRAGVLPGGSLLLGTGLSWKNVRTDLTALIHPQLGVSPGLMMCFRRSG